MNTLQNDQFLNNFEYLKGIIDEKKKLVDSDDVKNIISELKETLAIAQVPLRRRIKLLYNKTL